MTQAKKRKKIEATKERKGCTEMSDNNSGSYYEEDESYYDNLAEAWDERSGGGSGGSGGGGGNGAKKKAKPTTVGKKRVGGAQAWGSSDKVCPNSCTKKCCSGTGKSTPAM